MTALPRRRFIALVALCLFLAHNPRILTAGDNWNDLLSSFANTGRCRWEPKEYAECTLPPKDFEQTVKRVLGAPDLRISVIQDSEFNNKQTPTVLVGIRCAPVDYFLKLQGGIFGLGGEQVYETTQLYIQLLEPEQGVGHLRILTRSAEHVAGSSALQPLEDAPKGWQTARTVKERIFNAINNINSPL